MITLDQAKEFLSSYGVQISDVLLQAIVDTVNAIEPCLDGVDPPYTEAQKLMIMLYAVGVLAMSAATRIVNNEHAPSGASRGFHIYADALKSLKSSLAAMDKSGCTADIIAAAGGGSYLEFNVMRG